ncbi:hypothetical protein AMECASPLE_033795 [Ameca splendens]|uniref:Uncharacterized protein n=1 Tax=Ameca splendens TaxID=208324 RepID=A0ABV0XW79_9TELE
MGYTLDRLPVHHRATQIQRTNNHANTLIPKSNLERPLNLTVMFLDCGRKLEYQERTQACSMQRDPMLLATKQPCYQLNLPYFSLSFLGGDGGRGLSCNRWVAGLNPHSVRLSRCVLGQDTSPVLPADGGQRVRWCRLYGSITSGSSEVPYKHRPFTFYLIVAHFILSY